MTDKEKIRKEVVRMHNLLPIMDGDNISVNYADRICTTLEMYIDSLQEEPVSNDLEREIKHYVYDPYFDLNGVAVKGATDYLTVEDVADIARHFVQWQKEQMITKACEWLLKNDSYAKPTELLVRDFKKAMEE